MAILVSVCVQTYQHSEFIRECIDSILCQETSFPFEILLGEDCSTDGTREICVDYAYKYPEKIRLFLHSREDNIHVKGKPTGKYNFINNFNHARGKYISICEGDDYWTDNKKLQKQVDFMENNPDFSICFHAVDIFYNNNIVDDYLTPEKDSVTNILDLAHGNYIHTPSVLYRNCLTQGLPEFLNSIPIGDYPLHLLMAEHGKIKYLPEKMAVYRVHSDGYYSTLSNEEKMRGFLDVLNPLIFYFEKKPDVMNVLKDQRFRLLIQLLNFYRETGNDEETDKIFKQIYTDEPKLLMEYIFNKEDDLKITDENRRIIRDKMKRIIKHPISGIVIHLLAYLKRDDSFGKLDE